MGYTYLSRAFLTTNAPKTTPKTAKLADEIARPRDDFVDVLANYTDSEATTRDFFFAKLALNLIESFVELDVSCIKRVRNRIRAFWDGCEW